LFGGGVWESNPPELALAISLTVLKTAPFTGTVSPPKNRQRPNWSASKAPLLTKEGVAAVSADGVVLALSAQREIIRFVPFLTENYPFSQKPAIFDRKKPFFG